MTAAVLYDQQAHIVLITLHRPEALAFENEAVLIASNRQGETKQ